MARTVYVVTPTQLVVHETAGDFEVESPTGTTPTRRPAEASPQ
jgi:hypothetical protein